MERKDSTIYKMFDRLILDDGIKNLPLSEITRNFNQISKNVSFDTKNIYEVRQAFTMIEEFSKIIKVRLAESKKSAILLFLSILEEHKDFKDWFSSLTLPHQKYVCSFLLNCDWDYLKGFMSEEEINRWFNNITWSEATLISTFVLPNFRQRE